MSRHPVDVHVGSKIRHRRWLLEMTQQQLASACGIKFQQIQKYESGANRVSCSRLWQMSKAMAVTPSYFFEGLGQDWIAMNEPLGQLGCRVGAKAERLSPELARNIEALMDAQLAKDAELEAAA